MNRFLKKTISFSVLTFCIYIVAVCVLGYNDFRYFPEKHKMIPYRPASYGHFKTRIGEIPSFENVDVLVVGSSHAYRGFDPRIFEKHGLSLFNLGSSSQTPRQSYFLLKEYVDVIKPTQVIFEVFPRMFANDGAEGATDLISNDNLSLSLVGHALGYGDLIVFNTLVYRIFDEVILGSTYHEPITKREDTYISGGFVETDSSYHQPIGEIVPKPFDFKDEQFIYFERALDLLNKKGIGYILVQTPVSSVLAEVNPTPEIFVDRMKASGRYIDYQDDSLYVDSIDFFDVNHLSQRGVGVFNEILILDVFGE